MAINSDLINVLSDDLLSSLVDGIGKYYTLKEKCSNLAVSEEEDEYDYEETEYQYDYQEGKRFISFRL